MEKLIIKETPLLYPVKCELYANLDNELDIWIKFTSYLKPDEAILLENKDVNSIQKNEYLRIKNQLMISRLLLKYKNKNCSKEEYDLVTNFMNSMSLQTLIETKLTEEEIVLLAQSNVNESSSTYVGAEGAYQKVMDRKKVYLKPDIFRLEVFLNYFFTSRSFTKTG